MSPKKEGLTDYRAELHIHTVLSPCASVRMIPPLIIAEAKSKDINLISITDHNSIANIESVMEAAIGSGVSVLPGIELQTREEIHSLCLFDSLPQINNFYNEILDSFPAIKNNPDFFGEQFIVDKTGDFISKEDRLLISSSTLSLSEANKIVALHGGLLIPAHVNRNAYGLLPVLGLVPTDIEIEVLEISKHISTKQAIEKFPQLSGKILIQNGDAHSLDGIIGYNKFRIKEPTIAEIKLAFFGSDNRCYKNIH